MFEGYARSSAAAPALGILNFGLECIDERVCLVLLNSAQRDTSLCELEFDLDREVPEASYAGVPRLDAGHLGKRRFLALSHSQGGPNVDEALVTIERAVFHRASVKGSGGGHRSKSLHYVCAAGCLGLGDMAHCWSPGVSVAALG